MRYITIFLTSTLKVGLSIDSQKIVQEWRKDACHVKVLAEGGFLTPSQQWNIELLDAYALVCNSSGSLMYWKRVVLIDGLDVIALIKTNPDQTRPLPSRRFIHILENFTTTSLFTWTIPNSDPPYHELEFSYLPYHNSRAAYQEVTKVNIRLL